MITTALVCVTVLVLTHFYVAPRIDAWMAHRYTKPQSLESVMIPIDLLGQINSLGAQWAIDDARTFVLEEYERSKDWNAVRAALNSRG